MTSRKPLSERTFSILGDSYSTFFGWIPEGNAVYYPNPSCVDDVLRVEDTWWHILMTRNSMKLLYNDSYSGATVCAHTRDGQPPESSFTLRAHGLKDHKDENGNGPELVFLFGCTNDSCLKRTKGTLQFGNWTEEDLHRVLPAYCYVLDVLCREHPAAEVVCVVNTELDGSITEGMLQAAAHYGTVAVKLDSIDKQNGHPSALGMRQIADQVEAAVVRRRNNEP